MKQKFHFKNKMGALTYFMPSLACRAMTRQLKQTRTQLERKGLFFRNRGQQLASHAKPILQMHT